MKIQKSKNILTFIVLIFVFVLPFLWSDGAMAFSVQTGYYVGTGFSRSITGTGFQPDLVIIKSDTVAGRVVWRSSSMTGDSSAYFENAVPNDTGMITSLDTNGFSVGTSANVNTANVRYTWTAFYGSGGSDFKIGSYTGNGSDDRNITGINFQPDAVWVKRNGVSLAVWLTSSMAADNSHYFSATAPTANRIQAVQPDGFQVGTDPEVNLSGQTYYYVAFKSVSGSSAVGTYNGDGLDNRSIIGIGFKPDLVFLKQSNVASAAVLRSNQSYGDECQIFTATANAIDHVQALENDGFQVGTNARVNGAGIAYYYLAFKGATGPSLAGKFKMLSGSFVGNGTSQSFASVGFRPDMVMIKSDTNAGSAVFTTSQMAPNSTAYLGVATASFADGIISLDDNGFSIGSNAAVNSLAITYRWVAFSNSGATNFVMGAYTGTGGDDRSISGLGFQPDLVAIKSTGANFGVFRTSSIAGDATAYFSATADTADRIQAIEANGFQIGVNAEVNTAAITYFYFAFKNTSDQFQVSSYAGNAVDNRSITGVGFRPGLVWTKRPEVTTAAMYRPASLSGDSTQYFTATANAADSIQALESDGFQVGATLSNANGVTYRYAAWKSTSTKLAYKVQPSNAVAGVTVIPSVEVSVQDQYGNIDATDNTTSVSIGILTNPGGGMLSGTLIKQVSGGVATFENLSINKSGTGYTLRATAEGLTSVTSNPINISPASPNDLAYRTQPTSAIAGVKISPSVEVMSQDQFGNLVTSDSTTVVTIEILNNPGGGTLSGTLTKQVSGGVATFEELSINKTGAGYTLRSKADGLTSVTSNAFNISPASPNDLAFRTQPTSADAGVNILPSVEVTVRDQFGNIETADNTTVITIEIQSNPGGGVLAGTLTKRVVSGVSTFEILTINKSGAGYTLRATADALISATSDTFDITGTMPLPYVTFYSPTNEATNITSETTVTVEFSAAMNTNSVENAFTLTAIEDGGGIPINIPIGGSFSWAGNRITFTPSVSLTKSYTYRTYVSTEAVDTYGNPLQNALNVSFRIFSSGTTANVFVASDNKTKVECPAGALNVDYFMRISINPLGDPIEVNPIKINAADGKIAAIGNSFYYPVAGSYREFAVYNSSGTRITGKFLNDVTIYMPYTDANDDGIVDGTTPPLKVESLNIYRLNEANSLWVKVPNSALLTAQKCLAAQVPSFSTYVLMSTPALSLASAYVYPNPFKPSDGDTTITFTNLASACTIKIYTLSGELVKTIYESDGDGQNVWNVKNDAKEELRSGLYIYFIRSSNDTKTGKLVIIK